MKSSRIEGNRIGMYGYYNKDTLWHVMGSRLEHGSDKSPHVFGGSGQTWMKLQKRQVYKSKFCI